MTPFNSFKVFRWIFAPFHSCFGASRPKPQRGASTSPAPSVAEASLASTRSQKSSRILSTRSFKFEDIASEKDAASIFGTSSLANVSSRNVSQSSGLRWVTDQDSLIRKRTPVHDGGHLDYETLSVRSESPRTLYSPSPVLSTIAPTAVSTPPHAFQQLPPYSPLVGLGLEPSGSKPPLKLQTDLPAPLFTDALSASPVEMSPSEYPVYDEDGLIRVGFKRRPTRKASFKERRGGFILPNESDTETEDEDDGYCASISPVDDSDFFSDCRFSVCN